LFVVCITLFYSIIDYPSAWKKLSSSANDFFSNFMKLLKCCFREHLVAIKQFFWGKKSPNGEEKIILRMENFVCSWVF
jgi:hypothetical protein